MERREPDDLGGGLEGPLLLGRGLGTESPEELRALEVYEERMAAFERSLVRLVPKRRRRFRDYTIKNCEECAGSRERGPAVDDVDRYDRE